MDRFSKTCLILIVLLLAVIAARPLVAPQPARAAQLYEYQSFSTTGSKMPDDMNLAASKGWEVFAVTYSGPGFGYMVAVRKPKN